MAYEDFGSGFNDGLKSMDRHFDMLDRENNADSRAADYHSNALARAQLMKEKGNMIAARIAEMPAELAIRQQHAAIQQRLANVSQLRATLMGQKLQLEIEQMKKGGALQNNRDTVNQYKYGIPFQQPTVSGEVGTYVRPGPKERSQNQMVMNAWPQVVPAMQQIQKGAKYYQDSIDKTKKYIASLLATMSGTATKSDEKVLEDAGVSRDAIIQAAETAQRTFGFPKTNEGMANAFHLFTPSKGQTPQSFINSQQQLFRNMEERYWQAQYEENMGMPISDGSPQGDTALKDQKNFIRNQVAKNLFGSVTSSADDNGAGARIDKPSHNYTASEKDVIDAAKQAGISPQKMADILNGTA